MSEMLFAESFLEESKSITSERVRNHLTSALAMIQAFPQSGSTDVPSYIQSRYQGEVRKSVVSPFDLIYTYDTGSDVIRVRGLIPQKTVH